MLNLHVEIVINASLNSQWSDWFGGLKLEPGENGSTCISGDIPDQPALHGLFERIRDLNLALVSIQVKTNPLKGS